MAWQDRPYYRDSGGTTGNPLSWLWSGSVPLFTVFGIRVRMHALLLLTIVLVLLFGIGLYATVGVFPLGPWMFSRVFTHVVNPGWFQVSSYLFWIYAISYFLLLFNLIPVFPLDGGQMLQAALWSPLGYYKSMMLTLNIGLVGSVLMAMVGIATFGSVGGGLLLILIAVSCFINCFQMRAMMRAEGPWA